MCRIIIMGAGGIGCSIGGMLALAGTEVVLVARGAHGHALQTGGLHLGLPDRNEHLHISTVLHPSEITPRPDDLAILSTKLQDATPALDDLRTHFGPQLPIVCATNGMLGEQLAAERFDQVLAMMVWLAAVHLTPGHAEIHGEPCLGVLDVGDHPAGCGSIATALCEMLVAAGFESEARPDITAWKRAKWLTNLGGAAQALVEHDWVSAAKAATAEGEAVLKAAGLPTIPVKTLLARCANVGAAKVNGKARPGGSTWQSKALGKSLESSWLNGPMVELAETVGVAVPVNRALLAASRR